MARIELKDFGIKFWGQEEMILSGINMTFDTCERILLLSPSGRGKSTLLMSLLGVIQRNNLGKTEGEITVDGVRIEKMTSLEIARVFGIVFQEPESQFCLLYPDEEVAFALENMCVPQIDMEGEVSSALQSVGMLHMRREPLGSMSGGEQQRVAIASSLAAGSSMLLLDEPTANLDTEGRRDIRDQVAAMDKGFLLVEHNLDEWTEVVDRVVVLGEGGGLVWDTDTDRFLEKGRELLESLGIWLPGRKWTRGEERPFYNSPKELLRADSVTWRMGNKVIIDDLSMSVREGEIVALLGRNGSGKSTLSKILGRIIEPSGGRVVYEGRDIRKIKPEDYYSQVAYVFQNPEHQFIKDSVEAEINLTLANLGSGESSEDILRRYNLYRVRKENPFTLSGGEKRRLSVAVMLSHSHRVLILDEPTFGLDYRNARELMEDVADLAQGGMGVVIISHDMELVERYVSKAVVVRDGRKVFEGAPERLWDEPDILKENGLTVPMNRDIKIKKDSGVMAV